MSSTTESSLEGNTSQPLPLGEVAEKPVSFWRTFCWALYDLSNTIYSAAVVSIYFPAFIKDDLKANDIWYALPSAVAALLVGLFSPLMGMIADRGNNRMQWLVWTTLLSIAALFLMGFFPILGIIVLLFVVANSMYQAALMFYDALMPSVSTAKNWGKVSGFGVGLGYLGGIIGFLAVPYLTGLIFGTVDVKVIKNGIESFEKQPLNSNTFFVTAVLFFLLSLPCFIFVKEKHYRPAQDAPKITMRNSLTQTWRTLQEAAGYKGLLIFLISNFLYSDALNTVIVAMGIYSTEVIGLAPSERNGFLAMSSIFAILGGFGFGWVTDRLGPKMSLNISLSIWIGLFIFVIFAPPRDLFYWVGGPVAGIALGSVWVAARTLMIELTPPERLGEFMGIYNLTGKFSAVLGPALWGLTLFIFDPAGSFGKGGYQIAVGALLVLIVAGFILHQRVPVINRKNRAIAYKEAELATASTPA